MRQCGEALLTAEESRSEEGGMLVKINDCRGEPGTVCLVKRKNQVDLSIEG